MVGPSSAKPGCPTYDITVDLETVDLDHSIKDKWDNAAAECVVG